VDTRLTSAGLTRDNLAAEYAAGGLKPESYTALAAQGVDKAAVDQYFAGMQSQADSAAAAYEADVIKATVGTPEKYVELVGWAKTGLTPPEIVVYDAAVNSGDPARAAFAIAGLQARQAAANPTEPTLLNQGVPAGGVAGFESLAQMKAEMRDPRYGKDAAFREAVRVKLAASPASLR
jgi:hypothetical protein